VSKSVRVRKSEYVCGESAQERESKKGERHYAQITEEGGGRVGEGQGPAVYYSVP